MLVTTKRLADLVDDESETPGIDGSAGATVLELDEVVHQVVYLQLRPRFRVLGKCMGELEATLRAHPDVKVDIAGVGRNDHQFLLTLGIDAGPRKEIPKFGPTAVAALGLVEAMFSHLGDYMPRYTGAPTAEEVDLVSSLPNVLGAGAATRAGVLDATAG